MEVESRKLVFKVE